MGDKATLSKARQELEDLYLGVPDDSVDLTMKDLAGIQQNDAERKVVKSMSPIREEHVTGTKSKGLNKVPSIDFARAVAEAKEHHRRVEEKLSRSSTPRSNHTGTKVLVDRNVYDDASQFGGERNQMEERVGRRRQGIPHSNICSLCNDCIYVFKHRCLVCGRVYCRKCVGAGMGEMTEGRKCIECLGRRFSQRYIQRAGQSGCCWRYPSAMRQQELKWAEKGPRRSGERGYGKSGMPPRSRSPVVPRTPERLHAADDGRSGMPPRSRSPVVPRTPDRLHAADDAASFVTSSIFTPTSPHGFPI